MIKKVLKITIDGCWIECVRMEDKMNPFRVYRVTATHRRQIAKYGDFLSVIYFLRDFYQDGVDTMSLPEVLSWAKARGCI
jgi:hypothetical protein